ncbi:MAG: glycosyltransferase family 2 protein [Candidatus Brennerbacteria bacterium]|nr:glycosyltransferase family 2 protein [Candidatus Brennerbacteria bacterium]
MASKIDTVILTKDEEVNLPHALESVKPLDAKVWVVDSGSTDNTEKITRLHGAEFVSHTDYQNQAQQFNWALDHLPLKGEWVLRLDADEWLTPELAKEIMQKITSIQSGVNGFYMKRRMYFMGRWICHGGYYPTWILRLFRRGKGRSEEREMDEHVVLSEGCAERLKNDFADENRKSLPEWLAKHRDYAVREARAALRGHISDTRKLKKSFYYFLPPFVRPVLFFIYRYFFRLGFLDGIAGLKFHFLQGLWYRWLVDREIVKRR